GLTRLDPPVLPGALPHNMATPGLHAAAEPRPTGSHAERRVYDALPPPFPRLGPSVARRKTAGARGYRDTATLPLGLRSARLVGRREDGPLSWPRPRSPRRPHAP